ncbi:MAG: hypothetical protein Q8Q60_04035 [Candidatus Chromulinivorax sp.]|nr:hypothetical protein [Candidatus Chromulinivorax sp.]
MKKLLWLVVCFSVFSLDATLKKADSYTSLSESNSFCSLCLSIAHQSEIEENENHDCPTPKDLQPGKRCDYKIKSHCGAPDPSPRTTSSDDDQD